MPWSTTSISTQRPSLGGDARPSTRRPASEYFTALSSRLVTAETELAAVAQHA